MIPTTLTVIPLEDKVLLPHVVIRTVLTGQEATELTRRFFKKSDQESIYVVCVPLNPNKTSKELLEKGIVEETNDYSSIAPQVPLGNSSSEEKIQEQLVTPLQKVRLANFGCAAKIIRVQRSGSGIFGVYFEGIHRCLLEKEYIPDHHFYQQQQEIIKKKELKTALMYHVKYNPQENNISNMNNVIIEYKKLCDDFLLKMKELQMPESLMSQLTKMTTTMPPLALADLLVSIIETSFDEKWVMLKTIDPVQRIRLISNWMQRQLHVLQISQQVQSTVEGKLNKQQREFYLRQQLEAIRQELGYEQKEEDDMTELNRRLVEANMPTHAVVVAQRELKRIRRLQPSSTEWAVSRNYLEWMSEMPWNKKSNDIVDIQRAKQQLDDDHYGITHVKKRIIEHLSVIKMKGNLKSPIICFAGPPGVGKTSLGKSISTALTREFHRISLGGVRDEAEMRGHRRTYVGSQPGLIIQGIHKVGVNNPCILLDEIDKLVHSSHYGDPAAALLEILDPHQNKNFTDHYLNIPFDLSNVFFIATANDIENIPLPLADRMEIIELEGYTFEEKLHITKSHLLPKQLIEHGLDEKDISMSDEVIIKLIENYTRESGVRNLERKIASIVRAKCVEMADIHENKLLTSRYSPIITFDDLCKILGMPKFEKEIADRGNEIFGVATGLAYSGSGNGGILYIEASKMPGRGGDLLLTGSLGDVIKESAQIALTWVKSHAYELNLTSSRRANIVEHEDIHIHFPASSIPKNGPSAGVTLVCALVSLFGEWHIPSTTAMTGEMSLRGQVLPVGGIKEKVISAHRAGIRKIILPWKNKMDVETDIPSSIKMDIEFVYAKNIFDVLNAAFVKNEKWLTKSLESHL
ncbi:unnamed protein product [Cunninghamella blakesleeana]